MKLRSLLFALLLLYTMTNPEISLAQSGATGSKSASQPIALWPNGAPGEKGNIGEEKDMSKPTDNKVAGRELIRLGNVSNPTITVYRPSKQKDTGAAMVVCPGGGYHILALDLEGTEVCEWLNSIGGYGHITQIPCASAGRIAQVCASFAGCPTGIRYGT
jgi:hypothetical protein